MFPDVCSECIDLRADVRCPLVFIKEKAKGAI